jgi:hypothetical protein
MAVAHDGAWRKDGRGAGDSDQHNHSRGDGHGRRRVHDDAQRAAVGIALKCMVVGYLGHSQERQQDQAQQGNSTESVLLRGALSAGMCWKPCQNPIPCIKDTQIGCEGTNRGYIAGRF